MKKRAKLKEELMGIHIRKSKDYYKAIANVVEDNFGIEVDVDIKEKRNKEVVRIIHKDKIIQRRKSNPKFYKKFSNLNDLVEKAAEDYQSLVNALFAKKEAC